LQTDRYITATTGIYNNQVSKNGSLVFQSAAEPVSSLLDDLYRQLNIAYPKFHKMDRLSKLGLLGTEILLKDNFDKSRYQPDETGIVLCNASASLDTDIQYYKTVEAGPSPALFVYTLPNIVIGEISIRHRFTGENAFFVFKTFDATFIAQYIDGLFDEDLVKACIGGWVELLGENYRAFFFLVEKSPAGLKQSFNETVLRNLYNTDHG
jgi:hypothetical protein